MSNPYLGLAPGPFNLNFGLQWEEKDAVEVVRGDVVFIFVCLGLEADPIVSSAPAGTLNATVLQSLETSGNNLKQTLFLDNGLQFDITKTNPVLVAI